MKTKNNKNSKKNSINSEQDLLSILKNLNNRITAIELYLKMLDSTVLRLVSVIEILIDKKIVSKEEMIKKSEQLMEMDSELQKKLKLDLLNVLNSDDIGHA